jgi:Tfp pilus assembly protein PilP
MRLRILLLWCLGPLTVAAAAQAPTGAKLPTATSAPPAAATAPLPAIPPKGFTYESQGRRDPFVSVLRSGTDPEKPAVRKPGLAGLTVSEVSLKGTVDSSRGFVAILQGVDGRTYLVREGERLADGTVQSITQNTLTLLQPVNDPLSKDTQREVRKVLRQPDEAR